MALKLRTKALRPLFAKQAKLELISTSIAEKENGFGASHKSTKAISS